MRQAHYSLPKPVVWSNRFALIEIVPKVLLMSKLASRFDQIDRSLTAHMARYGITLLRLSVDAVFLWFGFLNFFPVLSSAADWATRTIHVLSFGLLPPPAALIILAA